VYYDNKGLWALIMGQAPEYGRLIYKPRQLS
jgi:hypothetical protein